MSGLDDRLTKVLDETDITEHKDYVITEIKAAFQEAGYKKSTMPSSKDPKGEDVIWMTGQEFYDRFKAELDALTTDLSFKGGVLEIVHEAARRASGVSE